MDIDGSACVHQAEVSDFHEAIGQDMLEEPAETLPGVEGGAWACTTGADGGAGHGALLEAHDAAVGDGDLEDRRGEVCEGRVTVWRD